MTTDEQATMQQGISECGWWTPEFTLSLKTRIKLATDLFLIARSLKLNGSKRNTRLDGILR